MAFTLEGNYKWGNFFYNVSYAVSDITGCAMSSDGLRLNVQAMANSQAVLMAIETEDGTISGFSHF